MLTHSSEIIRSLELTSSRVVADCGCGTGYYTRALADAVAPSGRVYAFDLNKSLIERISRVMQEEGHTHVYPVWCDLEVPSATGLRDGVLDALVCVNVLDHVANPTLVLRELYRILRSGGRAYIGHAIYAGTDEERGERITRMREDIKSLCCSVGFDHVVDGPSTDEFNYGLIAYRV